MLTSASDVMIDGMYWNPTRFFAVLKNNCSFTASLM